MRSFVQGAGWGRRSSRLWSEELARHGYRIGAGTLYPTLHRMEAEGLLRSRREVVAGRGRRVYRATAEGRRALTEAKRALRELADEVLV